MFWQAMVDYLHFLYRQLYSVRIAVILFFLIVTFSLVYDVFIPKDAWCKGNLLILYSAPLNAGCESPLLGIDSLDKLGLVLGNTLVVAFMVGLIEKLRGQRQALFVIIFASISTWVTSILFKQFTNFGAAGTSIIGISSWGLLTWIFLSYVLNRRLRILDDGFTWVQNRLRGFRLRPMSKDNSYLFLVGVLFSCAAASLVIMGFSYYYNWQQHVVGLIVFSVIWNIFLWHAENSTKIASPVHPS